MSKIFAWHVTAETYREELTFPVKVSEGDKITDLQIRKYLAAYCDKDEVDIPANFIFNLTFIAVDLDNKKYAESLSSFDFWPIPALEYAVENRSRFRQDSKIKKGDEK